MGRGRRPPAVGGSRGIMAQSKAGSEMIISKARTKALVKKCNVGGDFYDALDAATRGLIRKAEERALGNKRKTLKAVDV